MNQIEQVNRNGGYEAFEATDSKTLYYTKREPGIWRIPPGGGEETRVLEQGIWGNWALLEQGICLLNHRALSQFSLEFFNFATSQMGVGLPNAKKFTLSQTILYGVQIAFIHRHSGSWPGLA